MTTDNKRCCGECTTATLGHSIPQCFNPKCKCHGTENSWEERFEEGFVKSMLWTYFPIPEVKDFIRKEKALSEQRGRDMAVDYLLKRGGTVVGESETPIGIKVDYLTLEAARSLPDQHERV